MRRALLQHKVSTVDLSYTSPYKTQNNIFICLQLPVSTANHSVAESCFSKKHKDAGPFKNYTVNAAKTVKMATCHSTDNWSLQLVVCYLMMILVLVVLILSYLFDKKSKDNEPSKRQRADVNIRLKCSSWERKTSIYRSTILNQSMKTCESCLNMGIFRFADQLTYLCLNCIGSLLYNLICFYLFLLLILAFLISLHLEAPAFPIPLTILIALSLKSMGLCKLPLYSWLHYAHYRFKNMMTRS